MLDKLEYIRNGIVGYLTIRNMKCNDFCYPTYDFGFRSIMQMGLDLMELLPFYINTMELIMGSLVNYIFYLIGNYREYFNENLDEDAVVYLMAANLLAKSID
jgi:hypothetical protein